MLPCLGIETPARKLPSSTSAKDPSEDEIFRYLKYYFADLASVVTQSYDDCIFLGKNIDHT